MKKLLILPIFFIAIACGDSKKAKDGALGEKRTELAKLKTESKKLSEKIKSLEADIAKLDTGANKKQTARLISVTPVTTQDFSHYIELQGRIDADNISIVTPRGAPAQVTQMFVQKGQMVKKGQLLLKLDESIIKQNIVAAEQQKKGIVTQLEFAKNIYQRQKNLWDQGIGTEVQVITAKNNVEALENQIRATTEGINVIKEQLKTTNVYAEVSGIADEVNVRVGEVFQGMGMGGPQIRIVNTSSLKAIADIPENYISKIGKGSPVIVSVPDANRTYNSSISFTSASIDPNSRGFNSESRLPYDGSLKPNQIAIVKVLDYSAKNAVVVPVNVVQTDETGKYVYVMVTGSNGSKTARKKQVGIGQLYGEQIEIKVGLNPGEQLVTTGYQNLYDGQLVDIAAM
jgi:membrane fusion protein, multidrug efflux system